MADEPKGQDDTTPVEPVRLDEVREMRDRIRSQWPAVFGWHTYAQDRLPRNGFAEALARSMRGRV